MPEFSEQQNKGEKVSRYQGAFGLVNGDFLLRDIASPNPDGLTEGPIGSPGRRQKSLPFFQAFAQLLQLVQILLSSSSSSIAARHDVAKPLGLSH
jgi:hypothetical protein